MNRILFVGVPLYLMVMCLFVIVLSNDDKVPEPFKQKTTIRGISVGDEVETSDQYLSEAGGFPNYTPREKAYKSGYVVDICRDSELGWLVTFKCEQTNIIEIYHEINLQRYIGMKFRGDDRPSESVFMEVDNA